MMSGNQSEGQAPSKRKQKEKIDAYKRVTKEVLAPIERKAMQDVLAQFVKSQSFMEFEVAVSRILDTPEKALVLHFIKALMPEKHHSKIDDINLKIRMKFGLKTDSENPYGFTSDFLQRVNQDTSSSEEEHSHSSSDDRKSSESEESPKDMNSILSLYSVPHKIYPLEGMHSPPLPPRSHNNTPRNSTLSPLSDTSCPSPDLSRLNLNHHHQSSAESNPHAQNSHVANGTDIQFSERRSFSADTNLNGPYYEEIPENYVKDGKYLSLKSNSSSDDAPLLSSSSPDTSSRRTPSTNNLEQLEESDYFDPRPPKKQTQAKKNSTDDLASLDDKLLIDPNASLVPVLIPQATLRDRSSPSRHPADRSSPFSKGSPTPHSPGMRHPNHPSPPPVPLRRASLSPCGSFNTSAAPVKPELYMSGSISRGTAEQLLRFRGGTEGLFLVRKKTTDADSNFVISVISKGKFWHLLLEKNGTPYLTINGEPYGQYQNVEDLINALVDEGGRFAYPLIKPVLQEDGKSSPSP